MVELAEAWLTAKRAPESAARRRGATRDRARRSDLERWGLVVGEVRGRSPADDGPALAALTLRDLSEEALIGAVSAAKRRWSDATVARTLSTLPGFTRWLYRAGHLSADPLDGDLDEAAELLRVKPVEP